MALYACAEAKMQRTPVYQILETVRIDRRSPDGDDQIPSGGLAGWEKEFLRVWRRGAKAFCDKRSPCYAHHQTVHQRLALVIFSIFKEWICISKPQFSRRGIAHDISRLLNFAVLRTFVRLSRVWRGLLGRRDRRAAVPGPILLTSPPAASASGSGCNWPSRR